mmetsp:Transcript_78686/g.163637  ORF Transcript_78686/g.163637 Transcript_78686/m.163637 type:complete len:1018 (+) Transcript_78686:165-3218(+)
MAPFSKPPPTSEKLEALFNTFAGHDAGQVAIAADLLARLTETEENARFLCQHARGDGLLERCVSLAAMPTLPAETRSDVLMVLKNCMAVAEGKAMLCKDSTCLRRVLEAPPEKQTGEMATLLRHAWLGLVLNAVVSTQGSILEAHEGNHLEDSVIELCDTQTDPQGSAEGLLLLRHLYERRKTPMQPTEATRLVKLLVWAIGESDKHESWREWKGERARSPAEAVSHALHLLAAIGHQFPVRKALFHIDDEESEQLAPETAQHVNAMVNMLVVAVQKHGTTDPYAWRALSLTAEVKYVRRLMRNHACVKGLFRTLLASLAIQDRTLTEQLVSLLKQIFTGATDQFLSTDPTMFENLGKADGLKKLLSSLLTSWKDNPDIVHRGNIVAFLADAMFFSSFTDTWQVHNQASDLISILFDALLWKGVEGTAGLALGNFVSANGHIDLILDHDRAAHSISNVGWFLKRTSPGWDTKMQIYYLWRVLRSRKGCKLLCKHPHSDLIIAGLLTGVPYATTEDNEVLSLLECFLANEETRPSVLRGGNVSTMLEGLCDLLSMTGGGGDLSEPSCMLLQVLLEATGPSALLTWSGAAKMIGALSQVAAGKEVLDNLVPSLQWEPAMARALSLEYKRKWVSEVIRCSGGPAGDAAEIAVNRSDLLRDLLMKMKDGKPYQYGVKIRFVGEETGAGDGHRRECIRVAMAALCDREFGLFKSHDGGRSIHPSSIAVEAEPECMKYFHLVGKLIAVSLIHMETIPAARFTIALRKMILAAGPLHVGDMASVDPEFYLHKVQYLLLNKYMEEDKMSLSDLDLTFEDIPQPDLFPNASHELYPGGSQAQVTEENKLHYVELLCDSRMRGAVAEQVQAIIDGIRSIIPQDVWSLIQHIISPDELDLLICGLQEVDVNDWKAHSNCDVDQELWELFWAAIDSFDSDQQKALLEFATGSRTPPVGGFASLPGYGSVGDIQKFTLARNLNSTLPVASTCFNTIYLPKYTSQNEMADGLLEAVAHRDAGGFHEAAVAR